MVQSRLFAAFVSLHGSFGMFLVSFGTFTVGMRYILDRSPIFHRANTHRQPVTLTFTPMANLKSPVSLTHAFLLDCGSKVEYLERTPRRHGGNIHIEKSLSQLMDLNPVPCCCEQQC